MVRCFSGGSRLFGPEGGLWGRCSTCKVSLRRPNLRGDTAGMGIWIACIDTARIVR